jgi:thiamine biosynthesis lipoprotein
MGSRAEVVVVGGDERLARFAIERIDELERRWSRFRADSEVSRLNQAGGQPLVVSSDTVALVVHLVQAARATGGAFDPTLLPALVDLGDAVSRVDPSSVTRLPADVARRGDLDGILVDVEAGVVQLRAGTTLDPGGLGKGLAADLVAAALVERGAIGALVSLGGDVSVRGEAPQGAGWAVAVEDPLHPDRSVALVRLAVGGVATSGTTWRTWWHGGEHRHHLLDPATLRPLPSTGRHLVAATVIAGTTALAEGWATALVVSGPDALLEPLDRHGLGGLVVWSDGTVAHNATWEVYAA